MQVAAQVREIRRARHLSQRQLAGRMQVPRTYISKIENGKAIPTLGSLERLANALEVDMCQLVRDSRSRRDEEVAAILADPFLAEIAALLPHLDSLHRTLLLRRGARHGYGPPPHRLDRRAELFVIARGGRTRLLPCAGIATASAPVAALADFAAHRPHVLGSNCARRWLRSAGDFAGLAAERCRRSAARLAPLRTQTRLAVASWMHSAAPPHWKAQMHRRGDSFASNRHAAHR